MALIPERNGQVLRQALQARLGRQGAGSAYLLEARYSISREGVAILPDSSTTRIRLVAEAQYVLRSLEGGRATCLSGSARQIEGLDVANQQFFATDLGAEAAERRLTEAVAQQIASRLAVLFASSGGGCAAG